MRFNVLLHCSGFSSRDVLYRGGEYKYSRPYIYLPIFLNIALYVDSARHLLTLYWVAALVKFKAAPYSILVSYGSVSIPRTY
jgi:hypothetical protein